MTGRGVGFALGPEALAAVLSGLVLVVLLGPVASPGTTPGGPTSSASPATPAPTPSGPGSSVPPGQAGALTLAIATNGNVINIVDAIAVAGERPTVDPIEIRDLLTDLNPQLVFGSTFAETQLANYPVAAAARSEILRVYKALQVASSETQSVGIANVAAHVEGAAAIAAHAGELDAITAALQELLAPTGGSPVGAGPSPASSSPPGGSTPPGSGPLPSSGPPAQGLLVNQGFEDGVGEPWILQVSRPAIATRTPDSAVAASGATAARIDISNPAVSRGAILLFQGGLALEAGTRYRVSLMVRAAGDRDLFVRVASRTGQVYAVQRVAATARWALLDFDFSAIVADTDARLEIELGGATPTVWIDDVVVRPVAG